MHVGVDGCRAGWFAAGIDSDGEFLSYLSPTLESLFAAIGDATLILIDMPIGLPSASIPQRGCDTAARRLLGRRGSSVFPVPCRAALAADDYASASAVNEQVLGKRLSKQTWNIANKIRELDALLACKPDLPVREMHPEVAFCQLNGGVAVAASKKTPIGRQQRAELLERTCPGAAQAVVNFRRRHPKRQQLADDDILDALVGAVVAQAGQPLGTLPTEPWRDERGLVMEIVLPQAGSVQDHS